MRFYYFRSQRLSAETCLQHKWLAQTNQTMKSVKLSTDRLKKFIIRRKWQVNISPYHARHSYLFDSYEP